MSKFNSTASQGVSNFLHIQMIVEMDKEPSERQLMEEALSLAKNTTIPKGARIDALTALRYLVEPIDNAMGKRVWRKVS